MTKNGKKVNDKELIEVYNRSSTLQQTAAELGVTATTVRNTLLRNGLTPKSIKDRWDAKGGKVWEQIMAAKPIEKRKYLNATDIAEQIGISDLTVRRHLKKMAKEGHPLPEKINPAFLRG